MKSGKGREPIEDKKKGKKRNHDMMPHNSVTERSALRWVVEGKRHRGGDMGGERGGKRETIILLPQKCWKVKKIEGEREK